MYLVGGIHIFFCTFAARKGLFCLVVKDGMPESHCFDNIQINI